MADVEEKHMSLLKDRNAMLFLRDRRGIMEETVIKRKLGYDGQRYWIPVFIENVCVNVRKWWPKKSTIKIPKVLSYQAGYGQLKLYPYENIKLDPVILFEGEMDCILASQLGFNAITVTGGAGGWKDEFNKLLTGKQVYLCYDIDDAGRKGALSVSEKLKRHAKEIKIITLPITDPQNGDFTDYIMTHGYGRSDFEALVSSSIPYERASIIESQTPKDQEEKQVSLLDSSLAEHQNRRVKVMAQVIGKDLVPYVVPKNMSFICFGGLKMCQFCSIPDHHGNQKMEIKPDSQTLLKLISCSDDQKRGILRRVAGVHPTCPRFNLVEHDYYNLEELRLIPEINFHGMGEQEYVVRNVYRVGQGTRTNGFYEIKALATSDPRTQRATLIADKITPLRDSVSSFHLEPEQIEKLKIFQVEKGGDPYEKMMDIAKNLSVNATRIFQRELLHMVIDLVYHSVLQFKFQGQILRKGWCEALVLGDTRTGKTEAAGNLLEFYKSGEFCSAEAMSFAGLVGGLQQIGDHWSITWGKFPINDRRLVVIDEVSSLDVNLISQLSGIRSNGIAEVTKIQTERTHARCRLLWLSNPRSPRPINSYDHGVDAVRELIGRPEDIARFDIVLICSNDDVKLSDIHKMTLSKEELKYPTELCQQLVLWTWSRPIDKVVFTDNAVMADIKFSDKLAETYSAQLPVVEPNEQRFKLARLSAAVAARVFSTEDGETLLVKTEHVSTAYRILTECLNLPAFGYLDWSRQRLADTKFVDKQLVINTTVPYGEGFCNGLLDRRFIRIVDIEDLANLDKADAKRIIGILVRNQALKHYNTGYIKTPAFIALLRKLQTDKKIFKQMEFNSEDK
jgi:hypothetical protein